MPLITIENDGHFLSEMNKQGINLVVVDFYAVWCAPCRLIAPKVEEFSRKYRKATFLKVDVGKCQETATAQGVSAMPTFIFYRNKAKLGQIQGADPIALEEKIQQYYGVVENCDEEVDVPGHINLSTFFQKSQCEALNESDEHTFLQFLETPGTYFESDCDPQLIISLTFLQAVKIHSIKIKAPSNSGPKTIKLFINQPTTLDFDKATSNMPTQELILTPKDLEGVPVNLRYVKFQNVQNMQIFIKDNQGDEETTRVDDFVLYGLPVTTTNMGDFKRVSGKKGEVH